MSLRRWREDVSALSEIQGVVEGVESVGEGIEIADDSGLSEFVIRRRHREAVDNANQFRVERQQITRDGHVGRRASGAAHDGSSQLDGFCSVAKGVAAVHACINCLGCGNGIAGQMIECRISCLGEGSDWHGGEDS